MRILSISSLLPIQGIIKANDFVFQLYKNYLTVNKNDTVIIIKPVKYSYDPIKLLKRKSHLAKIGPERSKQINGFRVEIFPFLSAWSIKNLHALITGSIYFLNRNRLNKLISNYGFNVIHAQYIFPDGLLAYLIFKKYRIPYFVTTHNERFYFNHILSRRIAIKILKNATEVLPLNHTNYQYYKLLGINNIELLPLGFDKTFVRQQKTELKSYVSIFTASQLIKLKNIDKVLFAIKELAKTYSIHYTIIGTGTEKGSLMNLAHSLGLNDFVTFVDHVPHDKIADEMYKHDIFIMPSYFETFGRVYFEAMAMGIPIICAKNSGISGFFKEMEEGISVDHTSINEITKALEFLIIDSENRLKIGINGQNLVKNYTWDNIGKNLYEKYYNIMI